MAWRSRGSFSFFGDNALISLNVRGVLGLFGKTRNYSMRQLQVNRGLSVM